jgi:hypothetical protein
MLTTATVLFVLGALGGLFMAFRLFKGKGWPLSLAVLHGLLGAAGIVLVGWAVYRGLGAGTYLTVALVLFIVAALGGFVLFAAHLRSRPLSKPLVVVHALVAASALILLVVSL